jgi:hypothetical protein
MREYTNYATQDEAIAAALEESSPGEIVAVHEVTCKGREEPNPPYDVVGCTCDPLVLTVGAVA